MKITVFMGVCGSGKNFYADKFFKTCDKPTYISFSEPIRQMTWGILNWKPKDDKEYEKFKEEYKISVRTEEDKELNFITGRKILQLIGTDVLRNMYRDDIWAEIWGENAKKIINEGKHTDIVAYDCRYENEVRKILEISEYYNCDVQFIFCDYRSERYMILEHESEKMAVSLIGKFKDQDDITLYIKNKYDSHFSWLDNFRHFFKKGSSI